MSDQLILGIITAFGTMFATFMTYKMAELTKVAKKTHELANSMSLILARRLATATEKLAVADSTPENLEGAADAAKALKQAQDVQDLAVDSDKKM